MELIAILTCILLSACFSGAETAITSYGDLKAEHLLKQKGAKAHVLRLWLSDPARILTTILVGNNLVNILGSVLATDLALRHFPEGGLVLATATMTLMVLVFAEVLPKVFAKAYSEKVVLVAIRFVRIFGWLVYPLVILLSRFASSWLRRAGAGGIKPTVTEEELAFLVELGERQGTLDREKKRLLENVFQFGGTVAREVMVPRTDMVSISSETSGAQAVQQMLEEGHSRLPVYDGKIDNIVGIVHAKDLLRKVKESGTLEFPAQTVMHAPILVPESKPLDELLLEMRKHKRQMAIVLDEYGGTAGLITFEDLIEEIVGEIRDEYDEQEEDAVQDLGEGRYRVSGGMNYADFKKEFGRFFEEKVEEIPEGHLEATGRVDEPADDLLDEPYDTVGGMIMERLGRIPAKGERLRLGNLELVIADAGRRRVRKIQVQVLRGLNQNDRSAKKREEEREAS